MKKYIAAFGLSLVAFAAQANEIVAFQTVPTVIGSTEYGTVNPAIFTVTGIDNGNGNSGINLLYTFKNPMNFVQFDFTTSGYSVLAVSVMAGNNPFGGSWDRIVTDGGAYSWYFSAEEHNVTSVRFITAQNAIANVKTNNDVLNITAVRGAVSDGKIPEPATVALLGVGLLGFAASRRKSAKSKNA